MVAADFTDVAAAVVDGRMMMDGKILWGCPICLHQHQTAAFDIPTNNLHITSFHAAHTDSGASFIGKLKDHRQSRDGIFNTHQRATARGA
jgi:hypothetical protein